MANNKITKTKWKPTDNRFVGFLDILGFKDLVMRKSHDEIYAQLNAISKTKKWLENIAKKDEKFKKYGNAEINIVNFSDSIILFSKNDDIDNFKYFLLSLRYLFAKTIAKGIPLKGGFAYGEISVNQSEQIYFGQPIIDAYLIEEDVNYFGMVAHNSIDNYLDNNPELIGDELIEKLFFEDFIPLKSGKIQHRNINWFPKAYPNLEITNVDEAIESITKTITKFRNSVSGAPRRYVDNTLSVMSLIENEKLISQN